MFRAIQYLSRKKETKHIKENTDPKRLYHTQTLSELVSQFETSLANGLSAEQASQRLAKNGKNEIKPKKQNAVLKCIGYFFTGFCGLLWIAAIVCILCYKPLGDPNPQFINLAIGILLVIVILLQAAFTAFQDWSSNQVMKSIKNLLPSKAVVIRDGVESTVKLEDIVTGDLVVLINGNKVPADCRIIESNDLKFDNSMLTGESDPVEGATECTDERYVESKNVAFMTSLIVNGRGKAIVVDVGKDTIIGQVSKLTNSTKPKATSLQRELRRFVLIIVAAAIVTAIVVTIVWVVWLRVQYPAYLSTTSFLVNVISVMISFIPEGLPICVTLSLLVIAKRMAKSNVLVKDLSTIETLSCVNVIASDKTGTLTQNKMFVSSASVGLTKIALQADDDSEKSTMGFNQLVCSAGLCNNAHFTDDLDTMKNITNQRPAMGDATDIALLRFSTVFNKVKDLNDKYEIKDEIPFNSRNKWMVKVVRPVDKNVHKKIFDASDSADQPTGDMILLKGAPDILLGKSTHILQTDGSMVELNQDTFNQIFGIQNDWSKQGQRVLLICKKRCNYDDLLAKTVDQKLEELIQLTKDFCIIGLVGIIDPPREGISSVIEKCKDAGIRVMMVTGDYELTAAAIASQIGIFTNAEHFEKLADLKLREKSVKTKNKKMPKEHIKASLLLSGSEIEKLEPEDWRTVTLYQELVLARTTPEQKLKAVKAFQTDGYTVAVTGDGVNDAPALKSADIGIAMGSGSEVAMEASQLVLLDNNFSSIIVAIRSGRLVFCNLRKVILYLVPGGCFAELVTVLMAIFIGVPQDLSSFQMLVISLFTDIPPALSLMMEQEETDLLKQPPRAKNDHLVDWKFLIQAYAFLGILITFFSQCCFFIWMKVYTGLNASDIILSFNNLPATYNQSVYTTFGTVYINQSDLNKAFTNSYNAGQTFTFASIVIMQIVGNLMSTRTHLRSSLFQQVQWKKTTRNLYVHGAQLISCFLMIIAVYVTLFNTVFQSAPFDVYLLGLPLAFAILIVFLDELRKLLARRNLLYFHKFGW